MIKYNKFKNKKTLGYDSRKEWQRGQQLKLMQKQGLISDLEEQVTYRLEVNGILICKYRCDYQYKEIGVLVVEDVKSDFTAKLPVFRIKAKLMKAIYGIDVRII